MKRILVLPSWYPDRNQNSGTFFREQATILNSNGFDIKILTVNEIHTKFYWFQKFKRLINGQTSTLSTQLLIQNPEAFSFPVIIQKNWSEKKKISRIKKAYLMAYKEFEAIYWKPDLIHVQGTFKAGYGAFYIYKKYNIPYVTIEHSPFNLTGYSDYIQSEIKSVLYQAQKVAGVSNFQKTQIEKNDIQRPIEVVWNLLDEGFFTLKPNNNNGNTFTITTITSSLKVKDIETFFKGVSQFINSLDIKTKIEVNIVGADKTDDKTKKSCFERLATKYKIFENCIFTPKAQRSTILSILQKSHVFISTSKYESFGIAIREAMLCGVPVITTKSGGSQDSVNSNTGILVEVGDSIAISRAIKSIYNGVIKFDYLYIRNQIITQCGREAFLKRMQDFYQI